MVENLCKTGNNIINITVEEYLENTLEKIHPYVVWLYDKNEGYNVTYNECVAQYLCISTDEYIMKLVYDFNGKLKIRSESYSLIIFDKKEDAEKATEWLKDMILVKKLRGV